MCRPGREMGMASIDFEAEYNNRARVPEYQAIFARWDKEAAEYRATRASPGQSELGISYGPSARQTIDLFFPTHDDPPIAVFIHGGYWRSLAPSMFSHMARGLNGHGVTVAVVGYDLCPQVTIAQIIEQMRKSCLYLWERFNKRITIYGHSAGGHLAACLLATDWPSLDPTAPGDLATAGYSISGLFDLTPLIHTAMNADLRLDEATAKRVSPLFWPTPAGRTLDAVVGGAESSEFLRQSRIIVDAWGKTATTRYEAISGANHFVVLDPLADPQSAMAKQVADLCARTQTKS